jgi:Cft2 family RNA processing exonuclease
VLVAPVQPVDMANQVRVSPLWGASSGQQGDALCSLLELDSARILLDCGIPSSEAEIEAISDKVESLNASGGIDAVLLSHADVQHMGALPILFKKLEQKDVMVVCTLPVLKMGHLVLYDLQRNRAMEGGDSIFDLDDVDNALENVVTVKYNQVFALSPTVTVCARTCGRTIGSSAWNVTSPAGDILYAMDISLVKDTMLNGLKLSDIPTQPQLMIVENTTKLQNNIRKNSKRSRMKQRGLSGDDGKFPMTDLIKEVMSTIRNDGNVLIPCDTAGRTLNLLHALGSHWEKENLFAYQLVFLSHMSENIMDFARSQLEWMSDTLTNDFFRGKENPFLLPMIITVSSINEMDKKVKPGPKVVLATDASLSSGLSKQLLLRWGGDPRSKVIFTESLKQDKTLATEIRNKIGQPPLIVSVNKPEKIKLQGIELANYIKHKEDEARKIEEETQIMRRERELAQLVAGRRVVDENENDDDSGDSDDDEDDDVDNVIEKDNEMDVEADEAHKQSTEETPRKRTLISSASAANAAYQSGRINRFAKVSFPLFESKPHPEDDDLDYGLSISDLFPDDKKMKKMINHEPNGATTVLNTSTSGAAAVITASTNESKEDEPYKIISRQVRVQFTCSFVEIIGGRAPSTSLRTLLSTVRPRRITLLRHGGTELVTHAMQNMRLTKDCISLPSSNQNPTIYPMDTVSLNLNFPPEFFHIDMTIVSDIDTNTHSNADTKTVQVAAVGTFNRVDKALVGDNGLYTVQIKSSVDKDKGMALERPMMEDEEEYEEGDNERNGDSDGVGEIGPTGEEEIPIEGEERQDMVMDVDSKTDVEAEEERLEDLDGGALLRRALNYGTDAPAGLKIGAISLGDVTLDSLEANIKKHGIRVQREIENLQAFLLCGSGDSWARVLRDNTSENGFSLEGPPSPVLFTVRRAISDVFAFI